MFCLRLQEQELCRERVDVLRRPRSTQSLLGEFQLRGFDQATIVDALEGDGGLQLLLQTCTCLS